ncbi:hypothetical protein, partial [Burkholderia multivorans]|uniref:hypothetical protein n=1 Tax=Burkholderia multivorans TaxID=87883 RepID=UPI0019553C52
FRRSLREKPCRLIAMEDRARPAEQRVPARPDFIVPILFRPFSIRLALPYSGSRPDDIRKGGMGQCARLKAA